MTGIRPTPMKYPDPANKRITNCRPVCDRRPVGGRVDGWAVHVRPPWGDYWSLLAGHVACRFRAAEFCRICLFANVVCVRFVGFFCRGCYWFDGIVSGFCVVVDSGEFCNMSMFRDVYCRTRFFGSLGFFFKSIFFYGRINLNYILFINTTWISTIRYSLICHISW